MIKKKSRRKAFTLIEVITVLFVVSVALVGVMSLVVQSLNSQTYNKSNLIAYHLAQEGAEMIRGVRDSNWLAGPAWNANLGNGQYYMDYTDSAPHAYNPSVVPDQKILRLDNNGFYFHDPTGNATSSGFTRAIALGAFNNGEAMMIRVDISWLDHGRTYYYELVTYLYDWK